jgi:hypothetical protein
MGESKASRTLVKSLPELWSEVSNAASLQRHLDQFGEIHITRLEPEAAVAWEGEHARGTVRLEPSGWGTKVILTAEPLCPGGDRDARVQHEASNDAPGQPAAAAASMRTLGLPYETVEAEVRELTAFLERNRREVEMRRHRWPWRVARAVRKWFAPESNGALVAPEPWPVPAEPKPQPQAGAVAPEPWPVPSDREPQAGPAVPEPQPSEPLREAGSSSGPEPPQHLQREPAAPDSASVQPATPTVPRLKPGAPDAAALNAALDSLGRAHHRPFSRA